MIKRDPNHLGAIHYYIHAVEASNNPDRALPARTGWPASHPALDTSFTCPRTFTFAPETTKPPLRPTKRRLKWTALTSRQTGAQGIYPMMYYSHNLHFVAMCGAMNGRYTEARKNADLLAANVGPHVKDMPPLEGFMTIPGRGGDSFSSLERDC